MAANVKVHGLRELDRALGKANKTARTDLRAKLREIADVVAREARDRAPRLSGDLVRGIRPFALTGRAGVQSKAIHGGYRYPSRLEYEGRRGREWGPRASLLPAVEAKRGEVDRLAESLLDEIADDFHGKGF